MGSPLNAYKPTSKSNTADTILAYEEAYMRLLKRYKDDIETIESMMRELRDERQKFYTEKFPAIRRELENDDVSPEIRQQWIAEVRANVEKSFHISEMLIEHYITKNLDDFRRELEQALR